MSLPKIRHCSLPFCFRRSRGLREAAVEAPAKAQEQAMTRCVRVYLSYIYTPNTPKRLAPDVFLPIRWNQQVFIRKVQVRTLSTGRGQIPDQPNLVGCPLLHRASPPTHSLRPLGACPCPQWGIILPQSFALGTAVLCPGLTLKRNASSNPWNDLNRRQGCG